MTEHLKLVTDFATLRAGDLVVVNPCGHCCRMHRGMLVKLVADYWKRPDGSVGYGEAWEPLPAFDGDKHSKLGLVIGPITVARREVYLVDTGLEQTKTTERAEPKPLERVR